MLALWPVLPLTNDDRTEHVCVVQLYDRNTKAYRAMLHYSKRDIS